MVKAEIFSIGTELISYNKTDSNAPWLTQKLEELGINVIARHILKDDEEIIIQSVKNSFEKADLIITIGGLGPTEDDLTKFAISKIFNKKLIFKDEIWQHIKNRYKKQNRPVSELSKIQAYIPEGSSYFLNPIGSAPGIWIEYNKKVIAMLPGPPDEFQAMSEAYLLKRIKEFFGCSKVVNLIFRMIGLTELQVEKRLKKLYKKFPLISITILAMPAQVDLYFKIPEEQAVPLTLKEIKDFMENNFHKSIYATEEETIESVIGKILQEKKLTIAVAESCTGGLLANRITNVSGSSSYFECGVVSYSNDSKNYLLKVPEKLIKKYGAVSKQVALAMAKGVRVISGADIGIAITGIAGPTGGTPSKPVGTVHIALSSKNKNIHQSFHFLGNRTLIKHYSTQHAFVLLLKYFNS